MTSCAWLFALTAFCNMSWGGVGWGGDNNKRSLCSATWSFCHTSCYAAWSCLMPDAPLLDLSVTRHATLHDLVLCLMLRCLIFLPHVMLRCMILSYAWCSATWSFCHTSCYAAWSCLMPDAPLQDLSVTRHATLHDLVLCLMLRCLIFLSHVMLCCTILSYAWCSATWSFCHTSCCAHDLVLCLMLR